MVLDTIDENDVLIFKNTYENNKQYTVHAADPTAPDEFYFIHIESMILNPSRWWILKQRIQNCINIETFSLICNILLVIIGSPILVCIIIITLIGHAMGIIIKYILKLLYYYIIKLPFNNFRN